MTTTVVLLTGIAQLLDNAVLDADAMRKYPGATTFTHLATRARSRGWSFATWDRYRGTSIDTALLVSDMGAPARMPNVPGAVVPAASFCLESPLIADVYYHRLRRRRSPYRHVFGFGGAEQLLGDATATFHPLRWPNDSLARVDGLPWESRQFAVLVNSNKRAHRVTREVLEWRHPRQTARATLSGVRAGLYRITDPWLRSELYLTRLEAISAFSRSADFALYGRGWDRPVPGTGGRFDSAVRRCYRGEIDDKQTVLGAAKFVLCFENTVFPGYVTEKLFDALRAGAVPVYLGAPDVSDQVPPDCFVDVRRFPDWATLEAHLRTMDVDSIERMRSAGNEFLASADAALATADVLAESLVRAIAEVAP